MVAGMLGYVSAPKVLLLGRMACGKQCRLPSLGFCDSIVLRTITVNKILNARNARNSKRSVCVIGRKLCMEGNSPDSRTEAFLPAGE